LVLDIEILYSLLEAVVVLFVVLDPVGVLPFFMALTSERTHEQRKNLANRVVLISTIMLLTFAYLGYSILFLLQITFYDFEIAGGILLLVFAVRDALFHEPLGVNSTQSIESFAVVPLATPLLAGPGSITTVMLLSQIPSGFEIVGIAILVDCAFAWITLRAGTRLMKLIGSSGLTVIAKMLDIIMAAIAVSFLARGLVGFKLIP
jgi:multiple antibiotic resistance protein